MKQLCFWAALIWVIALSSARAGKDQPANRENEQENGKPDPLLTVERVFSSGELNSEFYSARWLPDGAAYTRLEKADGDASGRSVVRYDAPTGERQVMVSAALLTPPGTTTPLAIDDYAWSHDLSLLLIYTNSKRVWRQNTRGDYWLLDRSSRQIRQLGGDASPASLMFAKIAPDNKSVAFVRERNIYVEDLRDHTIRKLTETPSETIINGTFDWVNEEELGLRDGFQWSPDGRQIAFWQLDTEGVQRIPLINNTDSLYPTITWIPYPKVGQVNSSVRIGVIDVDSGNIVWMKIPGDPRNHYLARMQWIPGTRQLLIQQLDRLQKANRVFLADARDGDVEQLFAEHDEAWVDVHDELFWLDDGRQFTWISERDGWRHVYLVSLSSGAMRLLTPGSFDVIQLLHVDEDAQQIYFLASPEDPTRKFLFQAGLEGTEPKRVTPEAMRGSHSYRIGPEAAWAIHSQSSFTEPPVTSLVQLPSHETVRQLEQNRELREKLGTLVKGSAEFFRVDIGDGVQLDGWALLPPGFDKHLRYPVIVYVYGEPAGQTVVDRWAGRNYLWHLLLTQQGYIVLSIDNRGTKAPRGRQFRKAVHRKIGILPPQDQAAALRKLLDQRPYLDNQRIGIWGWSGGGSSSLQAIFKHPGLYHTAIAVAPVANQRYYDTIYQERYMGLPSDNLEGFLNGSPINFAGQLEGNLLLIHGTGDDNCHYQTTEMLVNELVRLNKPFALMSYPNRTHAISERKNTTRHLYELMDRYWMEHLPPGPREVSAEEDGDEAE